MADRLHSFAWCKWTNWKEACKENPNHIVQILPDEQPPNVNYDYFRIQASLWSKEFGCKAHVVISKGRGGIIWLQFCWRTDNHRRPHVDGATLRTEQELVYWADPAYQGRGSSPSLVWHEQNI
jgi:hypothetical protein